MKFTFQVPAISSVSEGKPYLKSYIIILIILIAIFLPSFLIIYNNDSTSVSLYNLFSILAFISGFAIFHILVTTFLLLYYMFLIWICGNKKD